jgi:uncharacterized protein
MKTPILKAAPLAAAVCLLFQSASFAAIELVPYKVPAAVADVQDFQLPDRVALEGWIGSRVSANEANRMVKIDTNRLLEGYRKRPGRQIWDGEHVGKWLHAATLAWANTGDKALREKLDYTARELSNCQLEDGYLGTYLDKDRWIEWDVWSHKYNLLGLITYMRYTGNMEPLPVCQKMGDLLCKEFGDQPGQRDIVLPAFGNHNGMASTSVLEPMVMLYRLTGETRYLDFCKYILRAWEQPNGPQIISRLLDSKRVDKVGNAKAYEMLSCLNGAMEYYRTVGGDRRILDACVNAWQDIVAKRLYITGTASYKEHFHDDYDLPNNNNVGETCVTTTWIQFNAHLLRLTGEARFADQLEKSALNHLFGAQKPDGTGWGYYVQLEGKKPYSDNLEGHCCLSSGPRAMVLIPTFTASTDAAGVVVNFYEKSKAKLTLRDGSAVALDTETRFPAEESVRIKVDPAGRKDFTVKLRIPAWCHGFSAKLAGEALKIEPGPDGYAAIRRTWAPGDVLELSLPMKASVVVGEHTNKGKAAVLYGPLVLAADESLLGDSAPNLDSISLAGDKPEALKVTPEPAPAGFQSWPGARAFSIHTMIRQESANRKAGEAHAIRLVPFADVGMTGASYRVWLSLAD